MTKEEIVYLIWGDIVLRGIPQITRDDVEGWVNVVLDNARPTLPSSLDDAAISICADILEGETIIVDGYECVVLSDAEKCFKAGAEWRDKQIPKLPSNLDDAADKWAKQDYVVYDTRKKSFKAGAEWMINQRESFEATDDCIAPNISRHQVQDILDNLGMIDENGNCPYTAEEIFKAGAEWMASQGITLEGMIDNTMGYPTRVAFNTYLTKDYETGDKVIVNIRKK